MDASKLPGLTATQIDDAQPEDAGEIGALIARARAGESDALGELMRLHERRVVQIGLQMGLGREDALDVCQETFIRVFRYLHRYDSGRPFFRWVHRIAVHAIYDHLRRQPPRAVPLEEIAPEELASLDAGRTTLDARIDATGVRQRLVASLDRLSRRERMVFVLRDLQEIPTEEVGRILGLSRVTIRRHCMQARRRLRELLFPPPD